MDYVFPEQKNFKQCPNYAKGLLFIGNASTVSLQYNIFNEMFQTLQAHVKILPNCHRIFLVEFTRECTMYLRLEHLYLAVGSIVMRFIMKIPFLVKKNRFYVSTVQYNICNLLTHLLNQMLIVKAVIYMYTLT